MLPSWSDLATYLQDQAKVINDASALTRTFKAIVEPFKIDAFACGKLHLINRHLAAFFVIEWPDTWRNYYMNSGLIKRDPVIDRLQDATSAFTWSELRRDRLLTKAGSEALRGAAEHGWTEGLIVPIDISAPVTGLVSLVSRRAAFTAEEKAFLTLVSSQFYQCAKDTALTTGLALAPAGLTRREIDCLQLVARGRSDRRVGEELGISTDTAHEHFENAKRKLNAPTRSAVIAIAIALAVIRPH